jgi:hypothetical protein
MITQEQAFFKLKQPTADAVNRGVACFCGACVINSYYTACFAKAQAKPSQPTSPFGLQEVA